MKKINSFKLAAFDFDGVLADTEPLHQRAKEILSARLGVKKQPDYAASVGLPNRDFWQKVLTDNGLEGADIGELEKKQYELIIEIAAEEKMRPTRGVEKLLELLRRRKLIRAVCSSSVRSYLESMLDILKLTDYFDFLVGGDEVAAKKPAPDVYLRALELAETPARQAFALEDSAAGLAAAESAGLFAIGFLNPGSGAQDLARAGLLIDEMDQLDRFFSARS